MKAIYDWLYYLPPLRFVRAWGFMGIVMFCIAILPREDLDKLEARAIKRGHEGLEDAILKHFDSLRWRPE